MARISCYKYSWLLVFFTLVAISSAQLSSTFYSSSCPNALSTIKSAVNAAVNNENRMAASLLRLHFHDCFVQASLFLLNLIRPSLGKVQLRNLTL